MVIHKKKDKNIYIYIYKGDIIIV